MLETMFYDYCKAMMESIQEDEMPAMERAADLIANAVAGSHSFLIHDRGHLIGGELLARAGGAAFVRRLDVALPDPALLAPHTGTRAASRARLSGDALMRRRRAFELEYVDYLFDINGLGQGDVLLLNSNSGHGFSATAIAQTAKKKGLTLIVMSSKATAGAVAPESGQQKLADFADVLLDNHAPYGDAVFTLEGLDEKLWPASGMGAACIAWPIILMAVERLLAMGVRPTIYRSVNIPGGAEQNQEVARRYEEKGY